VDFALQEVQAFLQRKECRVRQANQQIPTSDTSIGCGSNAGTTSGKIEMDPFRLKYDVFDDLWLITTQELLAYSG
jgi:hypothetical protein